MSSAGLAGGGLIVEFLDVEEKLKPNRTKSRKLSNEGETQVDTVLAFHHVSTLLRYYESGTHPNV
jgi:hypothetical protein